MALSTSPLSKSAPRRPQRPHSATRPALPACAPEMLEPRQLLSIAPSVETLVNISKLRENQSEASIAIDPTNPNRLFVSSNTSGGRDPDLGPTDTNPGDSVLFGATSTDGGVTWNGREFASGPTGSGGDNLPAACCDPSAEFDSFGNLWFTYLGVPLNAPAGSTDFHTFVLLSTDGGSTFTVQADLGGQDQPTITTGAGSVWVTWDNGGGIVASGAAVTGLGAVSLPAGQTPDPAGLRGPFTAPQSAPSSGGGFGDIAVGPTGAVMVTYQDPRGSQASSQIFVHTDPDGLGPQGFGPPVLVTQTNVGGFDLIPAQNRRSVDAEANLEWDRSGGAFNGRVYLAYTDEVEFESTAGNNSDLDVYVRFSDDNGAHWSQRLLVNDDVGLDTPRPRAQFLPQIALDQTTGNIAVGFHDARNDTGVDRNPNDDVQYFVAVGQPTADRTSVEFAPNVRVGVGQSDAKFADNGIDFGDYTGITFNSNTVYPAFADNSNSTGDNPSGARRSFDIYTGRVRVTDTTVVPPPAVTPGSPLAPTVIKESALIRKGRFYNLSVSYTAPTGATIDVATLGDNDLTVTGPNGFSSPMELRGFKRKLKGANVVAKYRSPAPGTDLRFDAADNGLYTITLNANAVVASNGTGTGAGVLSKFLVNAKPARTAGRRSIAGTFEVLPAAPAKRDDDGQAGATSLLTA